MPDGPGGFTQDYSCPALLRSPLRFGLLRVRGCHPLWRGFPVASTHGLSCDGTVLQPRRCRDNVGLGSSPVARHYWGNHSLFSFPAGTKMFQFPAFASRTGGIISLQDIGLSHSEIRGSRAICASPRLFAAYHVFIACKSLGIHRTPFITFACTVPLPSLRQWRDYGKGRTFLHMFVYIYLVRFFTFCLSNMSMTVLTHHKRANGGE